MAGKAKRLKGAGGEKSGNKSLRRGSYDAVRGGRMTAAEIAERIMVKAKTIREKHPSIARRLAALEVEIRERLLKLKSETEKLPQQEAELIEILTISRMEKLIEDTLGAR
jgi:hypothetical protein